jgi:hypothetical protein
LILPDPESRDDANMLAAPLCDACFQLPINVRLARSFKILRKMHLAKTGKRIAVHYVGKR